MTKVAAVMIELSSVNGSLRPPMILFFKKRAEYDRVISLLSRYLTRIY